MSDWSVPPTHMVYLPLDPAGRRLDPRGLCGSVLSRLTAVYADVTCPECRAIVRRRTRTNNLPVRG